MGCKFAPVAPIQVLEAMYDEDPHKFGSYHLLLAHHTAEHSKRFADLFARISDDNVIQPTIIMDNSVVECGGFVDFDMMHHACSVVSDNLENGECIAVLPDVMGDGAATRWEVNQAYALWVAEMPCDKFMAVLQGNDWDDYIQSLELFTHPSLYTEVTWLGIPRKLVETLGTREPAVQEALRLRRQGQQIHLLGYSDKMWDDLQCSHLLGVEGIDSAVPLRVGTPFSFELDAGKRPADWMETAQWDELMAQNLHTVREAHILGTRM